MLKRIEEIVKGACDFHGVSLYDLQWKPTTHGRLLLVKITRLGGVSLQDCKKVSRSIERDLEQEDPIEGRYTLEVSSPGLERELTRKSHFTSAINEKIKLTFQEEGTNHRLTGKLQEVNPDSISLITDEGLKEIFFTSIRKAKTLFDAKSDFQKAKKQEKIKELS